MKYDQRNKILYKFNPMAQVTIGRFFGYMLVFDSYANAIDYAKKKHELKFSYNNASQWNKLIKYIK